MAAGSSRVADRTQTRSSFLRSLLVSRSGRRALSRLVELHRLLERRRADLGVELGCLDPRVAEQAAHLLEIAVLLVDLHRDAVTQVVRLEHRIADQAAVGLAEPPDVLAFHRSP